MSVKHVIFDGFGTLVERQRPMSFHAYARHPSPVAIDWSCAMTAPWPWEEWAVSIGEQPALVADLQHIVLYSDIAATLGMLSKRGVGYSVMSNLASCYGAPLQQALEPFDVRHWFLSYTDGKKKPDPAYYKHALGILGLSPQEILFVGDHAKHDVQGPALAGMNALRIRRYHQTMDSMLEAWCS